MPATISAMPAYMPMSIGMPTSWKPMSRPIQNIGRCRPTPAVTTAQPSQKAQTWRRSERTEIDIRRARRR